MKFVLLAGHMGATEDNRTQKDQVLSLMLSAQVKQISQVLLLKFNSQI